MTDNAILLSHKKWNNAFAATEMDTEIIILSEISQNQMSYDIIYAWNPKNKWYKWTYSQNRNRLTVIVNKLIVTKGESGCTRRCFRCVRLFVTLRTVVSQAPPSVVFSRQEYWSGCCAVLQKIFLKQRSNLHLLPLLHWPDKIFTTSTNWERGKTRSLNLFTHNTIYKIGKQQERTVQHMELSSVSCNNLIIMETNLKSIYIHTYIYYQYSSVAQSCLTLCNPVDCSTRGLPVHHHLPVFTQTHVHWVHDAIQPSHPLPSPSPAFNLSQLQDLFKWLSSLHPVAKALEFQLQHQFFQWIFRTDFF